MKTILWSILCLFLSGWGSMQTVSAQDLQEMEKNLSAIRVDALYFLLSYNLYFIFILLTISVLSIVYVDYFPYLYKIL